MSAAMTTADATTELCDRQGRQARRHDQRALPGLGADLGARSRRYLSCNASQLPLRPADLAADRGRFRGAPVAVDLGA